MDRELEKDLWVLEATLFKACNANEPRSIKELATKARELREDLERAERKLSAVRDALEIIQ